MSSISTLAILAARSIGLSFTSRIFNSSGTLSVGVGIISKDVAAVEINLFKLSILLYALAAVPFGNRAADKSILVSSNILIVHYLLRAYLILTPSRHLQI